MMENHKDSKAMSLFEEFCDVDTLQNRIFSWSSAIARARKSAKRSPTG